MFEKNGWWWIQLLVKHLQIHIVTYHSTWRFIGLELLRYVSWLAWWQLNRNARDIAATWRDRVLRQAFGGEPKSTGSELAVVFRPLMRWGLRQSFTPFHPLLSHVKARHCSHLHDIHAYLWAHGGCLQVAMIHFQWAMVKRHPWPPLPCWSPGTRSSLCPSEHREATPATSCNWIRLDEFWRFPGVERRFHFSNWAFWDHWMDHDVSQVWYVNYVCTIM